MFGNATRCLYHYVLAPKQTRTLHLIEKYRGVSTILGNTQVFLRFSAPQHERSTSAHPSDKPSVEMPVWIFWVRSSL